MKKQIAQNTFRPSQITYDKNELVDCRNRSPMWMHSVNRQDTNNVRNIIASFGILILFLLFVICVLLALDFYPEAYPKKPIVNLNSSK